MSSSRARSRSAGGSVPRGCSSSLATSSRESTCGRRRLCLGARRFAVGSASMIPCRRRWRWNERRQATLRCSVAGATGGFSPSPAASEETNPARSECVTASASRPLGTRRTAGGPSGRPRACCERARARTPDTRGSRARGARTVQDVAGAGERASMTAIASTLRCPHEDPFRVQRAVRSAGAPGGPSAGRARSGSWSPCSR